MNPTNHPTHIATLSQSKIPNLSLFLFQYERLRWEKSAQGNDQDREKPYQAASFEAPNEKVIEEKMQQKKIPI